MGLEQHESEFTVDHGNKKRLTRCFSEKQNIDNMVMIKIKVDSRNVEN